MAILPITNWRLIASGELLFASCVAKDAERNDKIAVLFEQRQRMDQREMNAAVNEFRYLHQQPSSRREFDLYDPEAKKKDRPARVSDDDPRCGVASMQKFVGEDLTKRSRDTFQREQMRDWFDRQIEARTAAEGAQKEAARCVSLILNWSPRC